MRIGLVTADFFPNVGGVAAHVVELGRALVQLGHQVDVLTIPLGDQRDRHSTLHGMRIHRPPLIKGRPFYSWMLAFWLKRFLKTTPLDVLHVHGLRPLEATRGLPVPVFFTNHTSGFLKRIQRGPAECRRMARRMEHLAGVLAPSEELAESTRRVGYRGPVRFIANGVDVERFSPGICSLRNGWGISNDEPVVLLARRLVEKNGVCVFAEAITRLKTERFQVVFAGDGPERADVENILRRGGRSERCHFLGNIPNQRMPDIYRAADLSVLPSFMEATSITGLESMATGLPLVGTRVGGIPALIQDEITGLLVEPRDPDQLASAMDRLLANPALRTQMGAAARQSAINHFSWKHIAEQTVASYRIAVSKAA